MEFASGFVYVGEKNIDGGTGTSSAAQGSHYRTYGGNAALQNFLKVSADNIDRRVDSNIVRVPMSLISDPTTILDAPPIDCTNCGACASLSSLPGRDNIWVCEYCGVSTGKNITDFLRALEPYKFSDSIDYALPREHAPSVNKSLGPLLVFCIDVSGSMGVATEVVVEEEAPSLAAAPPQCWGCPICTLDNPVEAPVCGACGTGRPAHYDSPPQARQEPRRPTIKRQSSFYVSRLDAVRKAVERQLERMAAEYPEYRVALVVFNDNVTVVGDGGSPAKVYQGDVLHDYDHLYHLGEQAGLLIKKKVSATKRDLVDKLGQVFSAGQTALGPALMISLGMAATQPGSQVVICTDGLSNVGIGCMPPNPSKFEHDFNVGFFKRAAEHAASMGTIVSVISIKGEECNLNLLGILADTTGGSVSRVNVNQLAHSVSQINIVYPNVYGVKVRLVLHTGLSPLQRGLPIPEDGLEELNSYSQTLGTITDDSSVLFQFAPASTERLRDINQYPCVWPHRIPIQIQITYVSTDTRSVRMRVFTTDLPLTQDPDQALNDVKTSILSEFGVEISAQLLRAGEFDVSQKIMAAYRDLIARAEALKTTGDDDTYTTYVDSMSQIYNQLRVREGENDLYAATDELVNQTYHMRSLRRGKAKGSMNLKNPTYDSGPAVGGAQNPAVGGVQNPTYEVQLPASDDEDEIYEVLQRPQSSQLPNAKQPRKPHRGKPHGDNKIYASLDPSDMRQSQRHRPPLPPSADGNYAVLNPTNPVRPGSSLYDVARHGSSPATYDVPPSRSKSEHYNECQLNAPGADRPPTLPPRNTKRQ